MTFSLYIETTSRIPTDLSADNTDLQYAAKVRIYWDMNKEIRTALSGCPLID